MKYKNWLGLSIGTLLLIAIVQGIGVWIAYDSLRERTEKALNECFKKAFNRVVDDQINNLPYPDGTITHFLYYPVDTTSTTDYGEEMENVNFYLAQQSSAVLQDYYNQSEVSLDSLRLKLEKELHHNGVEGIISIQKLNVNTGDIVQESLGSDKIFLSIFSIVSSKAYLYEAKGVAVRAKVDFPLINRPVITWVLFCLFTLLLASGVIGSLFANISQLQIQKAFVNSQRQKYYEQAQEI